MIFSQNDVKHYDDFYMSNFNTLKIKSRAKVFYMPENCAELITLLKKFKDKNPIVLGNGSNVLFSSLGVDEPVIYTGKIDTILNLGTLIDVEAGYSTQKLSKFAYERGLSGFEFLIGIPASLGGAICMNAGAHKQTISDYLLSVKIYDKANAKVFNLKKEEMDFSYRHSIIKEKPYVILSAKFDLKKANPDEIKSKMDENLIFRKTRQPNLSLPNAGSVFKNPINCELSAGALIDKCDLRGYSIGDCEIYQNHCNFIINKGNATSADYTNLVFEIYQKVKEKFNIELEPEIIYIGNMSEEEKEKWKILKK